jgi:membrane protease YdiL (CAAX protease family)
MINSELPPNTSLNNPGALRYTILIAVALIAFSAVFMVVDNAYFKYTDARFPNVGVSGWLATLWGIVSRLHLLALLIPLVLWRPRWMGFQIGKINQHWRMLIIMLLANCGLIAAYLWLTHTTTPYSANQWLVTEVITVPVLEETFWRGLVFGLLLIAMQKIHPEATSKHLAVWFSGIAFGLLHVNNIFAGVPALFVAIQMLNATIWGVVYGYARAQTDSIYPPVLLHSAMNLVIILF